MKKKIFKKFLCVTLALSLAFGLLSTSAFAGAVEDQTLSEAQVAYGQAMSQYQAAQQLCASDEVSGLTSTQQAYDLAKADDDTALALLADTQANLAQAGTDFSQGTQELADAEAAIAELESQLSALDPELDADAIMEAQDSLAQANDDALAAQDKIDTAAQAVTDLTLAVEDATLAQQGTAAILAPLTQALADAQLIYDTAMASEENMALKRAVELAQLAANDAQSTKDNADAAEAVEAMIAALPAPEALTLQAVFDVRAVRHAYLTLTQTQQARIAQDVMVVLTAAEAQAELLLPSSSIITGTTQDIQTILDSQDTVALSGQVDPIVITRDCTVLLDNVTIQAGSDVSAITIAPELTVTVLVFGTCNLQGGAGGAGIAVPATSTLLVDGTGSLTCVGSDGSNSAKGGAGIGGTAVEGSSGTIQIANLSQLTAKGFGPQAAGIGSVTGNSAPITLTGVASVSVQGGYIGYENQTDSNGSPEGGPAIGGGGKGPDPSNNDGTGITGLCGDITILNTTIISAVGGNKCAAIGSACWSDAGTITVSDSQLSGILGGGCGGAGIGLGRFNTVASGDVTIVITNSIISAQGGALGPAIGTTSTDDFGQLNAQTTSSITIDRSDIHAIGGQAAAAIGAGYRFGNVDINIKNGSTIYAQGGIHQSKAELDQNGASAIGSGAYGSFCPGSGKTGKNGEVCTDNTGITEFYGICTIAIDSSCSVLALSNGSKWAIDLGRNLQNDVTGVAAMIQSRFLVEDGVLTFTHNNSSAQQYRNTFEKIDADDCQMITPNAQNTVVMAGRTVTLPAGYICAAATTAKTGDYQIQSNTSTDLFSQYDNAKAAFDYAGAQTLQSANPVFTAGATLADSSYLYVALRGDTLPQDPDPVVPDEPDDSNDSDPSDEPEVVIPDEQPPLANLPDEQPPLTQLPQEEVPTTELLPDEMVPMAEVPATGDMSALWLMIAGLSLAGLVALSLPSKKRGAREM